MILSTSNPFTLILKKIIIPLVVILLICSCKDQKSSKQTSDITENPMKDISELTYIEIYQTLFTDNNGGFDAHGDLYGTEAMPHLLIQKNIGSSCGDALLVSATSDAESEMNLAIRASFDFPGNQHKEMLRAYSIKPAEKISIGDSKLCYGGKEYDISREIVSAGFTDSTNN